MKTYPSIQGPSKIPHGHWYVFVKYDGSNLRFEWSSKKGWHKFGTRKTTFDENHPIYGSSIELFLEKYGDKLEEIFKRNKTFKNIKNFVAFAEWFGAKSFAGNHKQYDKKDIVLFDVNPHKMGILGPVDFLKYFGHLDVAELLYEGVITQQYVKNVKNETIEIGLKEKYVENWSLYWE